VWWELGGGDIFMELEGGGMGCGIVRGQTWRGIKSGLEKKIR
jgi:Fe-S cluster biogenesis protein NfuA